MHLNVASIFGQVMNKMQQELGTFGMTQHEARLTWLIWGLTWNTTQQTYFKMASDNINQLHNVLKH